MASCRQGRRLLLLLLLLLTAHPGPLKAQHWSHGWYPGGKRASISPWGLQRAPGLPDSPSQTARSLHHDALASAEDSVPWESRPVAQQPLHGKQHLVQNLLPETIPHVGAGGTRVWPASRRDDRAGRAQLEPKGSCP
ncbi:progonadoliberin-2 [Orycteropus afer afer]|uniref:Progonadoliberin n=1 Tax=Orycteropus afer afer TaxID=1230840 RepID=A0A8B6ZB69_ORYAF|nr:progonadoliberin-2 [Orycteropus afer afer]